MSASERLRALYPPMAMADLELTYEENARASFNATLALRNALPLIADGIAALQDLHERVEMDESVGICLSSRVESLRAGEALRRLSEHLEGGDE